MRALWARPLEVPGKALRPRWPAGYQARLRRPGNAVLRKTTHPLNIIDFTLVKAAATAETILEYPAATLCPYCRVSPSRYMPPIPHECPL